MGERERLICRIDSVDLSLCLPFTPVQKGANALYVLFSVLYTQFAIVPDVICTWVSCCSHKRKLFCYFCAHIFIKFDWWRRAVIIELALLFVQNSYKMIGWCTVHTTTKNRHNLPKTDMLHRHMEKNTFWLSAILSLLYGQQDLRVYAFVVSILC